MTNLRTKFESLTLTDAGANFSLWPLVLQRRFLGLPPQLGWNRYRVARLREHLVA
jgi:hypothetical protein